MAFSIAIIIKNLIYYIYGSINRWHIKNILRLVIHSFNVFTLPEAAEKTI